MSFKRFFLALSTFLILASVPVSGRAAGKFPDAPHGDALIEWWYANSHVTTESGRHYALVTAFFKFGADTSTNALGMPSIPPAHYLIWSVTDLDRGTHTAYSYADKPMTDGLKAMLALTGGNDPEALATLKLLINGKLPDPHRFIDGPVDIVPSPLDVHYGGAGDFAAVDGAYNTYRLKLGEPSLQPVPSGKAEDGVDLTLSSTKPVMKVNGNGETGLVKPADMYYYSLTRCNVTGKIDGEVVKSGQGWIDHQWGSSWTTKKYGWDWWGIQLSNDTDILLFQQRDLATGKTFFPLATFMDRSGKLTVTHHIQFRPDLAHGWQSPRTHARYPLAWNVEFPDQSLSLRIAADVDDQEMPILGPSGDIWEGSCSVTGTQRQIDIPGQVVDGALYQLLNGTAYMELVGYGRGPAEKPHK